MRVFRFVRLFKSDGGSLGGLQSADDFKAQVLGAKMPAGEDFLGIQPTPDSAEKAARAAAKPGGSVEQAASVPKQEAPPDAGVVADPAQGAGEMPATEPNAAQPPASGDGAGDTAGETGQSPKEITTAKLLEKYGGKKAAPGSLDLGKLASMPQAQRDKIQKALAENFEAGEDGELKLKPAAAARTLAAQRGQQQPAAPVYQVDEAKIWRDVRAKEKAYLESILDPDDVDGALRGEASQARIKEAAEAQVHGARQAKHQEAMKAYGAEAQRAKAAAEAFYERHPDAREGELGAAIDAWVSDIPEPIVVALINQGWLDLERIYESEVSKANFSRAIAEAFEEGQKNPTAVLQSGGAPATSTRGKAPGSQSPTFTTDSDFKSRVLGAGQLPSFDSLLK